MNDAGMTAAAVEFAVGGITYRLAPLSDRDYGEFERYVQDRYLDVAKRNLGGLMAEDRAGLLRAAYDKAASLTIASPEMLDIMRTVDGAAYLLYLSLRRDMPKITHERAKQFTTDPVILRQFMDRINELNKVEAAPKRPFRKAGPARGKRKRSRA